MKGYAILIVLGLFLVMVALSFYVGYRYGVVSEKQRCENEKNVFWEKRKEKEASLNKRLDDAIKELEKDEYEDDGRLGVGSF